MMAVLAEFWGVGLVFAPVVVGMVMGFMATGPAWGEV